MLGHRMTGGFNLKLMTGTDEWATERLIYNNRQYAIQELRERLLTIKQE